MPGLITFDPEETKKKPGPATQGRYPVADFLLPMAADPSNEINLPLNAIVNPSTLAPAARRMWDALKSLAKSEPGFAKVVDDFSRKSIPSKKTGAWLDQMSKGDDYFLPGYDKGNTTFARDQLMHEVENTPVRPMDLSVVQGGPDAEMATRMAEYESKNQAMMEEVFRRQAERQAKAQMDWANSPTQKTKVVGTGKELNLEAVPGEGLGGATNELDLSVIPGKPKLPEGVTALPQWEEYMLEHGGKTHYRKSLEEITKLKEDLSRPTMEQAFMDFAAKKHGDKWLDMSNQDLKALENEFKTSQRNTVRDYTDRLVREQRAKEQQAWAQEPSGRYTNPAQEQRKKTLKDGGLPWRDDTLPKLTAVPGEKLLPGGKSKAPLKGVESPPFDLPRSADGFMAEAYEHLSKFAKPSEIDSYLSAFAEGTWDTGDSALSRIAKKYGLDRKDLGEILKVYQGE